MKPILMGLSGLLVANAAVAQEVTLKAITAFTENTTYSRPFERFINRVNEDGKGILRINYIGGPKAMPPFEVGNALKGGVIDIANAAGAFYTNVMPEADAWKLTQLPMSELRQNGGYDYMAKLYLDKMNAIFLARHSDNNPFHLYLNKPIEKADLTGQKLRITPVYRDFFQALGAIGIGTRQNHCNCLVHMLLGQRVKQDIDGLVRPLLTFAGTQLQHAIGQSHAGVRRNHVQMIRLDGCAVRRGFNRDLGLLRQDFSKIALMPRIEMLHQQIDHAG